MSGQRPRWMLYRIVGLTIPMRRLDLPISNSSQLALRLAICAGVDGNRHRKKARTASCPATLTLAPIRTQVSATVSQISLFATALQSRLDKSPQPRGPRTDRRSRTRGTCGQPSTGCSADVPSQDERRTRCCRTRGPERSASSGPIVFCGGLPWRGMGQEDHLGPLLMPTRCSAPGSLES